MLNLDGIIYKVSKPARYTGGEWNSVVKHWEATLIKVAISYPDLYEIGMSNLGMAIIYDVLNRQTDVLTERVFTPWVDMEAEMRSAGIPLFSLESRRPVKEFDILGFSLGYELTYTNVLNMLDLAGIPLRACDRDDSFPLVIAGGGCALNPEPMAEFIDLFVVGEGEDIVIEFLEVYRRWKKEGSGRKDELLRHAARIAGIYVPGFYEVDYHHDGTLTLIKPKCTDAKPVIERRIVSKLPAALIRPLVPYIQVIHDRGAIEIQRGCSQGCRFCQAGMIYRPVRARSQEEVLKSVKELIRTCGYEEISLLSLNTANYPGIDNLVRQLWQKYRAENITMSLPSLRIDSFTPDLADALLNGRSKGFTFAPEAGTDRLRISINKDISNDDILQAVGIAYQRGWKNIKLYFMIGLPSEEQADIEGILDLTRRVWNIGKGKINLKISISTFVPKPHTPFQWVAQEGQKELAEKQRMIKSGLRKWAHLSWQDPNISLLEGVLSRGDRKISEVIMQAHELGCKFDAWSEHYSPEKWREAFSKCDLDPLFYACRERSLDELLPWAHIDTGIEIAFLRKEYQRARYGQKTTDCNLGSCNFCGLHNRQRDCQEKLQQSTAEQRLCGLT